MSWTCTRCGRSFSRKNQPHSCELRSISSHFTGRYASQRPVFDLLIRRIREFGHVTVSPVKNAIIVSGKSTFLAVKPKRDHLEIEFLLDFPIEEFPIKKSVRASRNRFAHFLELESAEEVNDQLIAWLHQSYNTMENA